MGTFLFQHEIVPAELITRIASLKHGGTYKVLKNLLKHKLVHHDSSKYDGFRLTYLGYDFLAIKTLVNRGVFSSVGRQLGVGKESDIFEVAKEDGTVMAMKLHRLGRTSFRAVKSKRDYLKHRSSFNWLYLSRLAALKEFAFMKALEEHGFPVPNAVDCNRHCVIMSLVDGYPLVQVKELPNPDVIFETIIGLVVRMAEHGLIHCDFNEFNIMIDDNEKVTMIDFPQMVSVSHRNAEMYFDRDVECVVKFFHKRFNLSFQENEDESNDLDVESDHGCWPRFADITKGTDSLDKDLAASGFTRHDQVAIERFIEGKQEDPSDDEETDESEPEIESIDEVNIKRLESLNFLEKDVDDQTIEKDGPTPSDESQLEQTINHEHDEQAGQVNDPEEDGSEEEDEDDPELEKRLSKQRKRAIRAAHGGKKSFSRNTYKDKGGKSSNNAKTQMQFSGW